MVLIDQVFSKDKYNIIRRPGNKKCSEKYDYRCKIKLCPCEILREDSILVANLSSLKSISSVTELRNHSHEATDIGADKGMHQMVKEYLRDILTTSNWLTRINASHKIMALQSS